MSILIWVRGGGVLRNKPWRIAQRKRMIKLRKKKIRHAKGADGCRWYQPELNHDGMYDKSKVYLGPHDTEDKESNMKRREARQNKHR